MSCEIYIDRRFRIVGGLSIFNPEDLGMSRSLEEVCHVLAVLKGLVVIYRIGSMSGFRRAFIVVVQQLTHSVFEVVDWVDDDGIAPDWGDANDRNIDRDRSE